MNDKKIGIFDSGIGGLTVLKELEKILPNESFIYFGDTKNLPYGDKTPEQLISFSKNIFNFFLTKDVKCVIMACNTTSAIVYDAIKDDYDIKIYPLIQNIRKNLNMYKKIGVFATAATVNSHAYKKNLPNTSVVEIACDGWVDIVENQTYYNNDSIDLIENYAIQMQSFSPEKIILGCTHYPYLKTSLIKFFDESMLINPAQIFAQNIKQDLELNNMLSLKPKKNEFFVSSMPIKFKKSASLFYELKEPPQIIQFE